jgi:hypothetical protein
MAITVAKNNGSELGYFEPSHLASRSLQYGMHGALPLAAAPPSLLTGAWAAQLDVTLQKARNGKS